MNYHDLLKDDEIDAVEILTPHHLHMEMAIAAAEAGKHISIQKPMALNPRDCEKIISATQKAGVILNICENFLFYPPILRLTYVNFFVVFGHFQAFGNSRMVIKNYFGEFIGGLFP